MCPCEEEGRRNAAHLPTNKLLVITNVVDIHHIFSCNIQKKIPGKLEGMIWECRQTSDRQ